MAAAAKSGLFVSGQWLTSAYNYIKWAADNAFHVADNAFHVADQCLGQQDIWVQGLASPAAGGQPCECHSLTRQRLPAHAVNKLV